MTARSMLTLLRHLRPIAMRDPGSRHLRRNAADAKPLSRGEEIFWSVLAWAAIGAWAYFTLGVPT